MGNSEAEIKVEYIEQKYKQVTHRENTFFGNHSLLGNPDNPQETLIRKEIIFRNQAEYQYFLEQYSKIDRKPFSLIYPKAVVQKESFQNCSAVREVKVYFQNSGQSLFDIVQQEGLFTEVKAWFLLNEISKALQIMDQSSRRAHWAVSPQTVFRNRTNNYLLYDSFFVFGTDPTHFLSATKKSNGPLTQKIQIMIERGSFPGQQEGKEQDTYALGFTILYALTGIPTKTLPPYPLQAQDIEKIIQSRNITLSKEIIDLIKSLTHRSSSKRMDIVQLRRLLQQKEADIIHCESIEYLQSRRKPGSNSPHQFQPLTLSSRQEAPRMRFNSPSFAVNRGPETTGRRVQLSPPPRPHLKHVSINFGHQQPRISLKSPNIRTQVPRSQGITLSRLRSLDWNRGKR